MPIAKTAPQKTIPQRMSRRYALSQLLSSLSIMALLLSYAGHHHPYAGEAVVDHVPEPLRLGGLILDPDEELLFVFGTANLGDVVERLVIVFHDVFGVSLQDVQRNPVAADDKCVFDIHNYSD